MQSLLISSVYLYKLYFTMLIFKICKIRSIRFVGNLIVNVCREFHYDDVNVTSLVEH